MASLSTTNSTDEVTDVTSTAKMWAKYGDAFFPCEEAVKLLPPGQYTIEVSQQRGVYFNTITVNTDELMVLPDTASDKIISQISEFWEKKAKYKKFNFVWKRGFLLWGPPGSGKTTTIQLVSKMIIDLGGLVVFVKNPAHAAAGLEILRKIEPERPVIVILEDLDTITQKYSESELLALLDGELQIQNVVFLATTNYPEKLDKRLVNRPSRFDVVQKIDYPNEDARRAYLLRKNPELADRKVDLTDADAAANIKTKIKTKQAEVQTLVANVADLKAKIATATSEVALADLESQLQTAHADAALLTADVDALSQQLAALSVTKAEIDMWVEKTKDFSIAHLKELILSVELFDVPFDQTIARLRKMMNSRLSHQSDGVTNI